MQRSISIIYLILLLSVSAFSQNKNSVFEELKAQMQDIEQIYVEVEAVRTGLKGIIKAHKGNNYKIVFGDRQITSDGSTVWNYSKVDKQVIISNLQDVKSSGLENIFFDMIDKMEPVSLTKKNNSSAGSSYELVLKNKERDDLIILQLDNEFNIKMLEISSFNEKWKILKLSTNDEKSKHKYSFTAPDSVEIIDLR